MQLKALQQGGCVAAGSDASHAAPLLCCAVLCSRVCRSGDMTHLCCAACSRGGLVSLVHCAMPSTQTHNTSICPLPCTHTPVLWVQVCSSCCCRRHSAAISSSGCTACCCRGSKTGCGRGSSCSCSCSRRLRRATAAAGGGRGQECAVAVRSAVCWGGGATAAASKPTGGPEHTGKALPHVVLLKSRGRLCQWTGCSTHTHTCCDRSQAGVLRLALGLSSAQVQHVVHRQRGRTEHTGAAAELLTPGCFILAMCVWLCVCGYVCGCAQLSQLQVCGADQERLLAAATQQRQAAAASTLQVRRCTSCLCGHQGCVHTMSSVCVLTGSRQ